MAETRTSPDDFTDEELLVMDPVKRKALFDAQYEKIMAFRRAFRDDEISRESNQS